MNTDTERTESACCPGGARATVSLCVLLLLAAVAIALPAGAPAEQGSQPTSAAAGGIDGGRHHTCALLAANVRCWGFNGDGQLGYGNKDTVGDDETPGSVGPVDLGLGRTAMAITAGDFHTCALLDDGGVRCWGLGGDGQLGYGNRDTIGDDEIPGSVGLVDLAPGRTARAITAGDYHACALLDDGRVRCWGYGGDGQLGYGDRTTIGDNETPGSVGPVDLGPGRTAIAISASGRHTCALLNDGNVRCWGIGFEGALGYGDRTTIGDNETPGSVGPVKLGPGRSATAISAGDGHTCATLDDGNVRCWGYGFRGQLGYGDTNYIGDNETPDSVGPVDLGPGRTAKAITAGDFHTCALLDTGGVRCWGYGGDGRLGYGDPNTIGDDETPGSVGPVDLGPGRTATAITGGGRHTCARLDTGSVRCWGYAANGQLGYCDRSRIGDDETPAAVGPVNLETPGAGCAGSGEGGTGTTPGSAGDQTGGGGSLTPTPGSRGVQSRGPGRVTGLVARPSSKSKIVLRFHATGTNGSRPPPARDYLVRQSRRPIGSARAFRRAQTLCKGSCRFAVPRVGARIILRITELRPATTYYYAVAARDNVSERLGPRSRTVTAKTPKTRRSLIRDR